MPQSSSLNKSFTSSAGEQFSPLSNKVNVSSSRCAPISALLFSFIPREFHRLARQFVGVLVFAARPPTSAGFTFMFSMANNDGLSERAARRLRGVRATVECEGRGPTPSETIRQAKVYTLAAHARAGGGNR